MDEGWGTLVGGVAAGVFLLAGNRLLACVAIAVALIVSSRPDEAGLDRSEETGLDPVRSFSDDDRQTLYARAGGRCQKCKVPVHLYEWACPLGGCDSDMQADHVFPHSKGGRTVLANGACLCRKCNQAKSDFVIRTRRVL